MTIETSASCPACRIRLRPEASFCTQCGTEVRPRCPSCGSAPRLLATMVERREELSSWCTACDTLLHACERCGRWLLPGSGVCPDPQCASRVLPIRAQHTGRRWDGRGTAVGWVWPVAWDRAHPAFRAPLAEEWPCEESVHTAFVAHGSLFVWAGTNLLIPDPAVGWVPVDEAGTALRPPPSSKDGLIAGAAWQCPLGPAGFPMAGVTFNERAAVAGACVVLAQERCYVQVGLRHRGDVYALGGGSPIAQAAGPGWWAGWSGGDGAETLRFARVLPTGDLSPVETLALPREAAIQRGSKLVVRDHQFYWVGTSGSIWALNCERGTAEPLLDLAEGFAWVWARDEGPRVVRERRGQVYLTLSITEDRQAGLGAPVGAGPLRGIYDHPELLLVAADRLIAFQPRTGERLCEALRPPGRWVDGALAAASDGEPRFLALTVESGFATLTAVRMSSGAQDLIWRQAHVEPRALLPVENELYVAHTRGVVRLRLR